MTATFVPSQEFEAKQLLFDLATDNENQRNFYQHMRRFAFSIIMTNTFGTRIKNWGSSGRAGCGKKSSHSPQNFTARGLHRR